LNAADITPVVSAAAVHKGLSQEMEWKWKNKTIYNPFEHLENHNKPLKNHQIV
jgi:hypothetical protein